VRKTLFQVLTVVVSAGLLVSCSAGNGSGQPTASPSTPSPSATAAPSASPSPDTETSVPAPAPATTRPATGPGAGTAELSIVVKPSEAEAAVSYTLVCQGGAPSAESQHPAPEAACAALMDNAALLSPSPPGPGQVCTEQYGGPQQATVTGMVDGAPVDATFTRTNGCEIGAWNAAQAVLGSDGGTV